MASQLIQWTENWNAYSITMSNRRAILKIFLHFVIVWKAVFSDLIPSVGELAGGMQTIHYVNLALDWNTANYVCEILGGSLLRVDDFKTAENLADFISSLEYKGDYQAAWIGLHWRILTGSTMSERSLVWSDTCGRFDRHRYSNFLHSHNENNGQDYCYRIISDNTWERKSCGDVNTFFCETRSDPYTNSYFEDTSHGMVPINKLSNETCQTACNLIYGCYWFSPASNSSCIVAIASLDADSGLSSFWRNRKNLTNEFDLTTVETIVGSAFNLGTIDTECTPETQDEIPEGLIDYKSRAFIAEDYQDDRGNDTAECSGTVTVENTHTTTVVSVLTETPEVSIIPTTVVQTTTITDAQLAIIPTTVVYTRTVTEAASTIVVSKTVELSPSCPLQSTTALNEQYSGSSTSTLNIEKSQSCENVSTEVETTTVTTTMLNTITDTYTVQETPGVTTATTTLYITEPAATSPCAGTETELVIVATDTVTVTATQMSSTICPSASQATVTVTAQSGDTSICSSSSNAGSSLNSTTANSVDMEQFEQEILAEMEIDTTATSKSRRKYSSATDDRTSSQAIGVFAVAFISVIVFVIVALDIPTFFMSLESGSLRG